MHTWVLGTSYTRAEIANRLGGSEVSYLPRNEGRVVCGCFTYDDNPLLPDIILPGTRKDILEEAAEFAQGYPVPVFIKLRENKWCYIGNYKVVRTSADPAEIERHHRMPGRQGKGRDTISQVLYLEPAGEYFDLQTMARTHPRAMIG